MIGIATRYESNSQWWYEAELTATSDKFWLLWLLWLWCLWLWTRGPGGGKGEGGQGMPIKQMRLSGKNTNQHVGGLIADYICTSPYCMLTVSQVKRLKHEEMTAMLC